MTIELRPAGGRPTTVEDGRTTHHSFSFGVHYDPGNVGFAAMSAHNDENLAAGAGYPPHPHQGIEIVTWVLAGALRHSDSSGRTAVLGPGELLRTSAGTGIVHSEVAETGVPTRFLQTWLRPDDPAAEPSYAGARAAEVDGLVEVVGPDGALQVGTHGARLHLGRLAAGETRLPDAGRLHVFVVQGEVALGDRALRAGDAARLLDEGGRVLSVPESAPESAPEPALVSVWSFA